MLRMGIDPEQEPGFEKVKGLRVYSRTATIELPWPELSNWPGYGLVMPRIDFDHLLVQRAEKAGARIMERTEAVEPLFGNGWVTRRAGPSGGRQGRRADARSTPGSRSRPTAPRAGSPSRRGSGATTRVRWGSRRAATTARRTTPAPGSSRGSTCGRATCCCPATAGCSRWTGGRINLGAGLLNTFKDFKQVSAQRLFNAFATMLPAEWEIDEEHAEGRVLSGPLPMSLNRVAAGRPRACC